MRLSRKDLPGCWTKLDWLYIVLGGDVLGYLELRILGVGPQFQKNNGFGVSCSVVSLGNQERLQAGEEGGVGRVTGYGHFL